METKVKVRSILITPSGNLLLIKRTRAGLAPYWVFPGGKVEDGDYSPEDALRREVNEELAGTATIHKLVYVLERVTSPSIAEKELYYLCDVDRWSEKDRTGPEFEKPDCGLYEYDEVPLAKSELASRNIAPDVMREFLLNHLADLDLLPDVCKTNTVPNSF